MYIPAESMPCNRVKLVEVECVYELHHHDTMGFVISRWNKDGQQYGYFCPEDGQWYKYASSHVYPLCWDKDYSYVLHKFWRYNPGINNFRIIGC